MEQKGFAPLENFLVFGRLSPAADDNDDGDDDDVLKWELPSLPLELHRQTYPCLSSQIEACVLYKSMAIFMSCKANQCLQRTGKFPQEELTAMHSLNQNSLAPNSSQAVHLTGRWNLWVRR